MAEKRTKPYAELLKAALAISNEAGQLDPHQQTPVLISYDHIIALRLALQVALPAIASQLKDS